MEIKEKAVIAAQKLLDNKPVIRARYAWSSLSLDFTEDISIYYHWGEPFHVDSTTLKFVPHCKFVVETQMGEVDITDALTEDQKMNLYLKMKEVAESAQSKALDELLESC